MSVPVIAIPEGHEDSVFVVSVSGGKDSTATLLLMLALRARLAAEGERMDLRFVFADTAWEAQETYEHIALLERTLGITVDRVGTPGGMVAKIRARAGFPARKQRWCTRELKVLAIRAYHNEIAEREGVDTVSVLGIRAAESEDRALMPAFGFDDLWDGYVWRPMIDADVSDVLAVHHAHGVPVNPLYRLGFSRVGCNPCIYATKEEIDLTAKHFPARIDQIRSLEAEVEAERVERNGVTPDRYKHGVATFFQAKLVERYITTRLWVATPKKGKPKGKLAPVQGDPPDGAKPGSWRAVRVPVYKPMRIDDIVAWSRTSRGGRQLKVLQEPPEGGCFRWGMCEPPSKDGDQ